MPKLILSCSFDFGDNDLKLATIVDDPDVLRKCAGSRVVDQWGDIEPLRGHSLIHLIALGATERTGCNQNGDGFKRAFLQDHHDTFRTNGALFRDHKADDFSKRHGDVVKTAYNDDMDRGELLVAARHDKCADWLADIEKDKRVDFSMGFDCQYDVCEICKKKSKTRKEYCEHVKRGAKAPYGMCRILDDGRKCFVDNPAGKFKDISKVGTGADAIAQHLRKVAGVDEAEIVGGADLMEATGLMTNTSDETVKMALAHKMSRMEKILPAMSFVSKRTERVEQKVAGILREQRPADMFGELAKIGCVLPLREFFKLAMAERFSEIESLVNAAQSKVATMWTDITESEERLRAICANHHYDGSKVGSRRVLNDYERAGLVTEFSVDPEIAEPRSVKLAIYGEPILQQQSLVDLGDSRIHFLLDEYAAYKLAALEATRWTLTDDVVRAAITVS